MVLPPTACAAFFRLFTSRIGLEPNDYEMEIVISLGDGLRLYPAFIFKSRSHGHKT